MTAIKCSCGKQTRNFERLTEKDLPNGWECDDLCGPKEEKQPEAPKEEPKQEQQSEQPKQEEKQSKKNKKRNKQE